MHMELERSRIDFTFTFQCSGLTFLMFLEQETPVSEGFGISSRFLNHKRNQQNCATDTVYIAQPQTRCNTLLKTFSFLFVSLKEKARTSES